MARRKRNSGGVIGLPFLIAILAGAVLYGWNATSPEQHMRFETGAGAAAVLVAVWAALAAVVKWRKRRAYLEAVAAFRWHKGMTPTQFETCCSDYLATRGWKSATTKGSGDQGVDVLAVKRGVKVVLQCKLYSRPVGNKAVQEAHAGMAFAGASRAAVVSNQGYTKGAKELAARTGVLLLHFTDLAEADEMFDVGRRG